jgi:hypothetical protein
MWQYVIATRKAQRIETAGLPPLQFSLVEQKLRAHPDIDVVDAIHPKGITGVLADVMTDGPGVLVAKMSEQKAADLLQQAQGRLIVERDQALGLLEVQQPSFVAGVTPTTAAGLVMPITVLGADNAPLKDAEVYVAGSLSSAFGLTDQRGQVAISLAGDTVQSIRSLYVKPRADYWSFYQTHPDMKGGENNVVVLRPLGGWHSMENFPKRQVFGWGQRAMRLDQVPHNYRGQGVRVALIDSGVAGTHDDLRKMRLGIDVINKKVNQSTWNEDAIAHGSHCAGLIAGADNGAGIRGFAPDAEVHVYKLFPGGLVSQLIEALEYCIEQQIDVVNLGVGGIRPSEVLEQQILRAKRAGVACVVAAGNSGERARYPASSSHVLTVAAIGKLNEFPTDSYHSQTVTTMMDAQGYFSPAFTCHGSDIDVCAPGVAITSCVPPNNYAVCDGTSAAAAHVAGLAALVLAHHPDFQGAPRNADRVDRLFQAIRLSAYRLELGDPGRTGYGLPDALVATGLHPQMGAAVGGLDPVEIGQFQFIPQTGPACLWGQQPAGPSLLSLANGMSPYLYAGYDRRWV